METRLVQPDDAEMPAALMRANGSARLGGDAQVPAGEPSLLAHSVNPGDADLVELNCRARVGTGGDR